MERTVEIVNKLGLHARAAAKFVTTANQYESEIRIRKGEKEVSGKSIMGVMMLAAAKGTQITIVAEGADAEAALDGLADLVARRFDEES